MTQKDFIQKVIEPCQNAVNIIGGYLPSVLIGQMCLETGYGEGDNCQVLMQWNNLLGMKTQLLNDTWTSQYWDGRSATKRTPEYYGYNTTIVDSFRVYNSVQQCACDYLQFMRDVKYSKNGSYKYRDVLTIKDPKELITQVSRRGYATDPQYITSVMSIVNKHNLTQYDKQGGSQPMTLSTALKQLGVNLIDIIDANKNQVPAHNANTHEYFAIHYLGVNGENPYLYGGGYGGHFYVSKKGQCYQAAKVTDKLWHVGASSGYSYIHSNARNNNTVGVECGTYTTSGKNNDNETWYFTQETQQTAAKLAAAFLTVYNLPLNHLLRHGDITTKNCPSPLKRDAGKGSNWTWDEFKNKVAQYMEQLKGSTSSVLKLGSSGEQVKKLQQNLKLVGFVDCIYYTTKNFVDGDFGINTETAVKYLQKAANLTVDGLFGPQSSAALDKLVKKANESKIDFTVKDFLNTAKKAAQQNKNKGYFYGNSPCLPSVYNSKTTSCDRYVDQVLYAAGLCDVGNRQVSALKDYLVSKKATLISDKSKVTAGDIVFLNGHVFILGYKTGENMWERYDAGSVDRIQLINQFSKYISQPFIESIDGFKFAYRLPFAQQKTSSATTNLSVGSQGKKIKQMQQKLIRVGYYCGDAGADGIFGKNTETAIKTFQTDFNLQVDGIYGPQSTQKLNELYNKVKNYETPKTYTNIKKILTTTEPLNLRKGAGTSNEIILEIPKNKKVKWNGYSTNSWYYVIYNNGIGFVNKNYLK